MKKMIFTKISGSGNSFLIIESAKNLPLKQLTIKACDRNNGIGADGLLVLSKSLKADYRMRVINADGSEAEMCGNGARCLSAYIVKYKKPKKKIFTIETKAGIILGTAQGSTARIRLSPPNEYKSDVLIDVNGRKMRVSYIDTGVPHTIIFVSELDKIDVFKIGRSIRYHKSFSPRGTNVDFVEILKDNLIKVRTYERGVENETGACGTGCVASAIVTYQKTKKQNVTRNININVLTQSNEILEVTFDSNENTISNIWLQGHVNLIARGEYYAI